MTGDVATPLGKVGQIGIIVDDIAAAARTYERMFGVDSWLRYTYSPRLVPRLLYRGAPGGFAVHIALGGSDPQIELMEPVEGPSIYHEHLSTAGPGLHHVGVFVDSLDDAVTTMTGLGYEVLQLGAGYGLDGDGGFAYFDTITDFQIIVEAVERPQRRPPSLPNWNGAMEGSPTEQGGR